MATELSSVTNPIIGKPEMLRTRAAMLRRTRRFFDDAGFIEVQTPCLSSDNVVDAHIDPVEVPGTALLLAKGMAAPQYYLQTSPEFAMKRLLADGMGSIYSLGPVFRAGERSPRHNIEFTMLEWYSVSASMEDVIHQTIELIDLTLPFGRPRVITYRKLFQQSLQFDPIEASIETVLNSVQNASTNIFLDHPLSINCSRYARKARVLTGR